MTLRTDISRAENNGEDAFAGSAMQRVFATYELREHVFSYLACRDLMPILQVDKTSNYLTHRSKKLRTGLFIESEVEKSPCHDTEPFQPKFFLPVPVTRPSEEPYPLLYYFKLCREQSNEESAEWEAEVHWTTMEYLLRMRGKGQSREAMNLTQPPTTKVVVLIDQVGSGLFSAWWDTLYFTNTEGIRMGDMVDAVSKALESDRRKEFHASQVKERCYLGDRMWYTMKLQSY